MFIEKLNLSMNNSPMKYLINIIILLIFFTSCKSEIQKIDLKDVEAHRNYQNKLIDSCKTSELKLITINRLITEYKKLDVKDNERAKLYYLIGRLNHIGFTLPFDDVYYDSLSNKFVDQSSYEYFVDNTYDYYKKSLLIDSNFIKPMVGLSNFMWEEAEIAYKTKNKSSFLQRNQNAYSELMNYIVNNSLRFIDIDKTPDKTDSKKIVESSLLINATIDEDKSNGIKLNDPNTQAKLKHIEASFKFLDQVNVGFIKKSIYTRFKNYYMPYINQANTILEQARIENEFNQINIQHKYAFVDADAGVYSSLDLTDPKTYIQVGGVFGDFQNTISGRGRYSRNGHTLVFLSTSGISVSGEARLEYENNKLVIIILNTGAVYVQDDDLYYIKNFTSTQSFGYKYKSQSDDNN